MRLHALPSRSPPLQPEGLSLAIHPTTGVPHLSFTDAANSYRASVVRPSGPAGKWLLVGKAGFGGGNPDLSSVFVLDAYTSLAFTPGPTPIPLVAYLVRAAARLVGRLCTRAGVWPVCCLWLGTKAAVWPWHSLSGQPMLVHGGTAISLPIVKHQPPHCH